MPTEMVRAEQDSLAMADQVEPDVAAAEAFPPGAIAPDSRDGLEPPHGRSQEPPGGSAPDVEHGYYTYDSSGGFRFQD